MGFGGWTLSATIAGANSEQVPWADLERAADRACQAQKKPAKGCYVLAASPSPEPAPGRGGGLPVPIKDEATHPIEAQQFRLFAARTVQPWAALRCGWTRGVRAYTRRAAGPSHLIRAPERLTSRPTPPSHSERGHPAAASSERAEAQRAGRARPGGPASGS